MIQVKEQIDKNEKILEQLEAAKKGLSRDLLQKKQFKGGWKTQNITFPEGSIYEPQFYRLQNKETHLAPYGGSSSSAFCLF